MRIAGMAREGVPLVAGCALLGAVLAALGWWKAAAAAGLGALACAGFFRDPERTAPPDENALLSPADGRIVEVTPLENGGHRVGIFLAVWNVHVNRAPFGGTVRGVRHERGEFLAAFNPEAPTRNERNEVTLDTLLGPVTVTQIAGLIARRIVCRVKEGDVLQRGQRYGLIQFGSRVDCVLPPGVEPRVQKGMHLRGGESIIGLARKEVSA